MLVRTRIAIVFAALAIAFGAVALLGIGMDNAFGDPTPRVNPGVLALICLIVAALSFMLSIWSAMLPVLAKLVISIALLLASWWLSFVAFIWMFMVG